MTRRRLVIITVGVASLLVLVCCSAGALFILLFGVDDGGSPELAQEWKAVLEPLADPESAREKHPLVVSKRFATGEWVFGFCRDSHGLLQRGGGTMVIKDSRGEVRAFFGHVCGAGYLELVDAPQSLDEFYNSLLTGERRFYEYPWPKDLAEPGTGADRPR